MRSPAHTVLGIALALAGAAVAAEAAPEVNQDETDWLVARRNGAWELVAKGAQGRVHKEYPNQEVLRLGAGSFVEVVSMPPLAADQEMACAQRARRDARDPCSSSFLLCRPDPAGAAHALGALMLGGTDAVADGRNRLSCRVDVDAILRAARDVGMIRRILPRDEAR